MKNYSVLILTFNEENNITDCIDSVATSNDIVVLDSYSQDLTKERALSRSIRFYERSFTNYSDQRNYGLHEVSYKNEYVLILDADERAPEDLRTELLKICNTAEVNLLNVYLIRRRVVLGKRILKWNLTATVLIERLVRPKKVSFFGDVHERLRYDGHYGVLKSYIIHHQFSKGFHNWIERRKKYAMLEQANPTVLYTDLLNDRNVIVHRIKIRAFFTQKVPCFYILYLAYNIFINCAFLDGYKGLAYVILESYSLFLVSKKKIC